MLRQQAMAFAAAILPALGTVYLDTLPPGPSWPWDVWALDLAVVLACWHVIALATMHVVATLVRRRRRYGPAWLGA